ncbi:SDR family oxidoreductase [Janibacter sp. G56]|uniref:SDR family oxidoreductase n=1 Tax=Janibacter sp. G56 TaxID=3418717 RepID=UPI003CFD7164
MVERLDDAGHDVASASRRTGVDLASGEGVTEALAGADVVVHTADTGNPLQWDEVTIGGTMTLIDAAASTDPPPHIVYISIVGCDRSAFRYYRAKAAAERALARHAHVPTTVLRATQFHPLAASLARSSTLGPLALGLRGLRMQPIDVDAVADRLAEIAAGPSPRGPARARDIAGPDVLRLDEIATLVARRAGRPAPRVLPLPPIGATLRSFARGDNLPGPDVDVRGRSFSDWLDADPHT